MKTFTIRHTEVLVKDFEIEAESQEEALNKYWDMWNQCELDYSDEELIESSDEIVNEEE